MGVADFGIHPTIQPSNHPRQRAREPREAFAIAAGERQSRATVENNGVFAMKERLEFLDAVDVHDSRAADADEIPGGEALLDGSHRFAEQVARLANVNIDIVI